VGFKTTLGESNPVPFWLQVDHPNHCAVLCPAASGLKASRLKNEPKNKLLSTLSDVHGFLSPTNLCTRHYERLNFAPSHFQVPRWCPSTGVRCSVHARTPRSSGKWHGCSPSTCTCEGRGGEGGAVCVVTLAHPSLPQGTHSFSPGIFLFGTCWLFFLFSFLF